MSSTLAPRTVPPARATARPPTGVVRLGSGRRMAYDRHGREGPVVVLLHGIPGWRGTFADVGELLGARFQVIAPDLLGFGDSDGAPDGAHAMEHAEAVDELLRALSVDAFHLVGFDFGGPTAVHLAGRRRSAVRSLALLATNLFPDTPIPGPLRLAKVPVLGTIFFRLAFGKLGLTAMWWAAVKARGSFPLWRHRRALRGAGARSTRRILLASMRDLPGLYSDVERIARKLDLPASVLWGDSDPFFPVQVGERTAEAVGADLRVLRGCGHFLPEERADHVAREIGLLVDRSER